MKKILIVTSYLSKNGTETFIMNLYRHLNRDIVQFDFLISSTPDGFYEEILSLGGQVYVTCSRRKNFIKNYLEIKRFFKIHSTEYEAIHYCGGSLSEIIHIVQAYKYNIPKRIIHSHNSSCDSMFTKILHHINKKRIHKFGTHFWACSQSAANWFYKGIIPPDKVKIIPNGIEINKFKFNSIKRREVRHMLDINDDDLVLGHVGRFTEIKNQTFLVDMFNYICNKGIKAKLLLIGEGELLNIIKQKVLDLSLSDKVIFAGRRDNINDYLQAMDCFVMPSLYEGLPFVLIEAQASGLSIIASNNISRESNITNTIEYLDLDNGTEYWANFISQHATINNTRRDMSESIIKAGYSATEMARYIEDIYTS